MVTKSDASRALVVVPVMMMAMNAQAVPMPPMMPVTPTAMMMPAPMAVAVTHLDHVALREISIQSDGLSEQARADIRRCRAEHGHEACKQNAQNC